MLVYKPWRRRIDQRRQHGDLLSLHGETVIEASELYGMAGASDQAASKERVSAGLNNTSKVRPGTLIASTKNTGE